MDIALGYFFLGATATPHVFPAFLSPIVQERTRSRPIENVGGKLNRGEDWGVLSTQNSGGIGLR
jgi:hypothetical protein